MRISSFSGLFFAAASFAASLPDYKPPSLVPDTVVIEGWRLVDAKARLLFGDKKLKAALGHLTAQADSWLNQGPWTVTTKTTPPPNGTLHDYASQAPYFWPNPNTPNGCPYINKDGQRNPEVDKYQDRLAVGKMFNSSYVLSLAWYYTGKKEYALHASDILRTWFVEPSTAMNPNLNHAQIVPCANDGRSIGIIDFSQEYTNVIDAVAILSTGAPGWTTGDLSAFKAWNKQAEAAATNNHGTFANMQIAALALFTGNTTLARQRAELAKTFINTQITANGSQPQELSRTRSYHYSNFDLGAHLRYALIASKVGVDLFRYTGPDGQSILKAANFLIPAAVKGQSAWAYEELEFTAYAATDNIHAAANAGLREAKGAVGRLVPPPGGIFLI
ncbi:hypothetical protein PT974_02148 [Cladobotryum mycophilum]|uniref:Alginate lyase domain-containing protein n=1 Tax=Cladobotryum mycophilum TaxID=491253 RepID=A0ABR0SX87_9HYPO